MLPQIVHEFITPDEQAVLVPWILSVHGELMENGLNRHFRQLDYLPRHPKLLPELRARIASLLQIEDVLEPVFRSYVSVIHPGAAIHHHTDTAPTGKDHVRCNVFLQLPEYGGMPIVEGQTYPVRERDLLYFTPNRHEHWTDETGPGLRIIASFGFLVPTGE